MVDCSLTYLRVGTLIFWTSFQFHKRVVFVYIIYLLENDSKRLTEYIRRLRWGVLTNFMRKLNTRQNYVTRTHRSVLFLDCKNDVNQFSSQINNYQVSTHSGLLRFLRRTLFSRQHYCFVLAAYARHGLFCCEEIIIFWIRSSRLYWFSSGSAPPLPVLRSWVRIPFLFETFMCCSTFKRWRKHEETVMS